jgi:CheY-like chemotaxis protein
MSPNDSRALPGDVDRFQPAPIPEGEEPVKDFPHKEDTILIADAEPYNLRFILDFLESLKYKLVVAESANDALLRLQECRFRAVLADLSVPLLPPLSLLPGREPLFRKWPGLLVADSARNHDYTGKQVVVYSIYDDAQVSELANRLGIAYVLKGRPRLLKQEVQAALSANGLAKPNV